MKAKTKSLLKEAEDYCNENDKSTEFMIQYMQDVANVDLDCVLNYLQKEINKGWKKLENSGLDKPFKSME